MRKKINNAFYDELECWQTQENHPLVLLRAENSVRNPWIERVINKKFPTTRCQVLDIGCGGGLLTNFLAEKGHAVFGIDLSEQSLENAHRHDQTKKVHYQKANASALPFEEGKFDVVCAMDILEHVEEPEKVIQEASRVLKKEGLFFFHTFNRNFFSWFMVIKGVEWFVPNTPLNMHVYSLFLKPKELNNLCEKYQMRVEEMKGLNPDLLCLSFWKMIFLKKIESDIRFKFTSSLIAGYSGFSIKN